ncbi:hypothetical protein niasHT_029517 [Heterodera trifolii]|uniref:Ubiquitin-like domain-containing protein n=1 Tax=Heterodera trifolii TaxID=157864 RepID=A0ABD2JAV8_9BILA
MVELFFRTADVAQQAFTLTVDEALTVAQIKIQVLDTLGLALEANQQMVLFHAGEELGNALTAAELNIEPPGFIVIFVIADAGEAAANEDAANDDAANEDAANDDAAADEQEDEEQPAHQPAAAHLHHQNPFAHGQQQGVHVHAQPPVAAPPHNQQDEQEDDNEPGAHLVDHNQPPH